MLLLLALSLVRVQSDVGPVPRDNPDYCPDGHFHFRAEGRGPGLGYQSDKCFYTETDWVCPADCEIFSGSQCHFSAEPTELCWYPNTRVDQKIRLKGSDLCVSVIGTAPGNVKLEECAQSSTTWSHMAEYRIYGDFATDARTKCLKLESETENDGTKQVSASSCTFITRFIWYPDNSIRYNSYADSRRCLTVLDAQPQQQVLEQVCESPPSENQQWEFFEFKTCASAGAACTTPGLFSKSGDTICAACGETECCQPKTCSNQGVTCTTPGFFRKSGDCTTCDETECCQQKTCSNQDVTCTTPGFFRKSGDCTTCDETECCQQKTCSNQDVTCATTAFLSISKDESTSCISCVDDGNECCQAPLCEFEEWGTGLPFAEGGQISLTPNLMASELKIDFKLKTEPCVDRENWLQLTYHDTAAPVCEGGQGCSLKDEQECKLETNPCRFRIPCKQAELGTTITDAVFSSSVPKYDIPQQTAFEIKIHTDKLSTNDASVIYTKPTENSNDANIEFCLRPAVEVVTQVGGSDKTTEVLYRELVLRIKIGMDGTFDSFSVESDSFQDGAVQDVDTSDVVFTAKGFACTDSNNDGTYEELSAPTLKPNEIFTLCVVPTLTAVQCENILTLNFAQDRGSEYTETRIGENAKNLLLTGVPTTTDVDYQGSKFTGCVVDTRLGADFFASTSPQPVSVSGSALFNFKAASGRKLREESPRSSMAMAVLGKRNLQVDEPDPIAKFDMQVQLSKDQVSNNKPQVDAGYGIGEYCVATSVAAAVVSQMI